MVVNILGTVKQGMPGNSRRSKDVWLEDLTPVKAHTLYPTCGKSIRSPAERFETLSAGPELVVRVPEDARARFIVDSVACYVLLDGCAFEQALMTREAHNPEYTFLFDLASPDHLYYRWRLYSLSQVSRPSTPPPCPQP